MGDIIDFRKSKRAGKPIAKVCTHLQTKFDRLNRQLICAQCGEVIDANAWLYRHFEQCLTIERKANNAKYSKFKRGGQCLQQITR